MHAKIKKTAGLFVSCWFLFACFLKVKCWIKVQELTVKAYKKSGKTGGTKRNQNNR